jgi:hypothetical protein
MVLRSYWTQVYVPVLTSVLPVTRQSQVIGSQGRLSTIPIHDNNLPSSKSLTRDADEIGTDWSRYQNPACGGSRWHCLRTVNDYERRDDLALVPSASEAQPPVVTRHSRKLTTALNLRPFAGIAFLWFMGVIRDAWGILKTASSPQSTWVVVCCMLP